MFIALWASWLVLFFVTKILAAVLYFAVLLIYMKLPWRTPNQRGYWLIAHRGRGLLMIMGFVMLLTVLLSWLLGLPKKLRAFREKINADQQQDKGDDHDE